ncbi:MAG: hypothetical protein VB120_07475 [Lachnospiraceae bacterium]|nr:hypothetical protein [Lachnospiraceae bacterium]
MNRNFFLIFLLSAIMLFSGCSNNSKESATKIERNVNLSNLGLAYSTPEEWEKYAETNLYPWTYRTDYTLSEICYSYITEADLESLSTDYQKTLSESLIPICEIVVIPDENLETEYVKNLIASYGSSYKAGEQNGHTFYFLWDYTGDKTRLDEENLANYNDLASYSEKIKDTIITSEFDPEKALTSSINLSGYLTFATTDLYGSPVESTIFANYKLTMVNFNGTYNYENINESSTLQKVYAELKGDPNINMIAVVIDLPDEENEALAKSAYEEADCEYTAIMPDEILAGWIKSNLKGVPTTLFVNSDGEIIGDTIQGSKSAEDYLSAAYENMNLIK